MISNLQAISTSRCSQKLIVIVIHRLHHCWYLWSYPVMDAVAKLKSMLGAGGAVKANQDEAEKDLCLSEGRLKTKSAMLMAAMNGHPLPRGSWAHLLRELPRHGHLRRKSGARGQGSREEEGRCEAEKEVEEVAEHLMAANASR